MHRVRDDNKNFDWNQIVTKPVVTSDGREIGKVDGLEDLEFVVKDGLVDPKFYRIPRDKVETYVDGKVKLGISEEQASSFRRPNAGYYQHDDSTRMSNTTAG